MDFVSAIDDLLSELRVCVAERQDAPCLRAPELALLVGYINGLESGVVVPGSAVRDLYIYLDRADSADDPRDVWAELHGYLRAVLDRATGASAGVEAQQVETTGTVEWGVRWSGNDGVERMDGPATAAAAVARARAGEVVSRTRDGMFCGPWKPVSS